MDGSLYNRKLKSNSTGKTFTDFHNALTKSFRPPFWWITNLWWDPMKESYNNFKNGDRRNCSKDKTNYSYIRCYWLWPHNPSCNLVDSRNVFSVQTNSWAFLNHSLFTILNCLKKETKITSTLLRNWKQNKNLYFILYTMSRNWPGGKLWESSKFDIEWTK